MIEVNGIQLDFDITAPDDVLRYQQALERAQGRDDDPTYPPMSPDDPDFLNAYRAFLEATLRNFADYVDEIFGEGTAYKLFDGKASINKMYDINDALNEAMEKHGEESGIRIQKYTPNRAQRRAAGNNG